jgi:hypothetical protein
MTKHASLAERIPLPTELTVAQLRSAQMTVMELARDEGDARLLLDTLGLLEVGR